MGFWELTYRSLEPFIALEESIVNRVPKSCWKRVLLIAVLTSLLPGAAQAGLGGYVEYGYLHYAARWDDDGFVENGDQAHVVSAGVAYDTNLAADSLVNYRVNVGYRHLEKQKGDDDLQLDGLALNVTVGFAPIRTQDMRVWAGPSFGFSYLLCEDCAGSGNRADVHQASFGIGPEIGVNFHLGESLTFGVTGHYQFESTSQKTYFPNRTSFDRGWQGRAGLNFSFFFRDDGDVFEDE